MTDYFTSLGIAPTFNRVFHMFKKRCGALTIITLMVYVLGWVFALIASTLLGADMQIDGFSVGLRVGWGDMTSSATGMEDWQYYIYVIESLIYYCFMTVAHAANVWLTTHLYLDQTPTVVDALMEAGKRLRTLLLALAYVFLIVLVPIVPLSAIGTALDRGGASGALIFCMVLALEYVFFMQLLYYHVYPVVMVENKGACDALSRSSKLSYNHICYMFAVVVLFGILQLVLGVAIAFIGTQGTVHHTELIFNDDDASDGNYDYEYRTSYTWPFYLAKVLDAAFGILFATLGSVFQAVLYIRNRVCEEQLTNVMLATDLGCDTDESYIAMTSPTPDNELKTDAGVV